MKKFLLISAFALVATMAAIAQPYYLRGSAEPCNWGGNFTGTCELTDPDSNGVYELTYNYGTTAIGAQEFKVYNQATDQWWPSNANAWFNHQGGSVTFRFKTADNSVEASGDAVASICAPGEFSGWQNATAMTSAGNNIWCYTVATPGTYQWKPVACGTWSSWQPSNGERSNNSDNWVVTTNTANQQVCVQYDPATGRVSSVEAPPPPACTNPAISATATNKSATFTWSVVVGSGGYKIRYRRVGTTTYSTINIAAEATSTYTLNGLFFGTSYQYSIKSNCNATWGPTKTISTLNTPECMLPYFVSVTPASTSVAFKWRNVPNKTGQTLQYKKSSVTTWTNIQVPLVDSSRTVTGLTAATTYNYRLRVKCGTTWTSWTPSASVNTNAFNGDDNGTQNLVAVGNATDIISVSPNPTTGNLSVKFESADAATVVISDATGRRIQTWTGVATGQTIDVSSLPAGIYVVQTILADNRYQSTRIVKM